SWMIEFSPCSSSRKPRPPGAFNSIWLGAALRGPAGFFRLNIRLYVRLMVGDPEARPDGQRGELIDRVAAGAPVRKLLFVEALGHTRVPFAGYRPDHRTGVELAAIDAHRAAEAAADLEGRFDDGVARQTRRDRFEIGDFAGRAAAGHSVP